MARENEKECLKTIKYAILGKIKINIYCNCEIKNVSNYLFVARDNSNANCFPDFVFDGGGIEHFELTSSKETRKGSEFKIEESQNRKAKESYRSNVEEEFFASDYTTGTMLTSDYEEIYENFSYKDFLKSLKKNAESHVSSLEKSQYQDKTIVFLMEQQTARLWIDEGVIPIKFYELHKDKLALEIIKDTCKNINYLVYFVGDSIEIIDVNKIDELISKACVYKNVKGGRLIKYEIMLCLDT